MKTFFEMCLLTIPEVLRQELSRTADFVPADDAPSQAAALTVLVSLGSGIGDRFIVATQLSSLRPLFVEAGLTGSEPDAHHDSDLWRGFLRRAASAAARAIGRGEAPLVENTAWPTGTSFSTYELRLGEQAMRLGFASIGDPAEPVPVSEEIGSGFTVDMPSKGSFAAIDLLLDVELEASLRFGSCEMSLNEVLELGPGDVVELDRHVTDPVDLLVGDKIVARGEVVLINGNFGLRVHEIAEPKQCLETVRCLF